MKRAKLVAGMLMGFAMRAVKKPPMMMVVMVVEGQAKMVMLEMTALMTVMVVLAAGCGKSSSVQGPPDTQNHDSAQVTVVNGYGSGRYKTGDTVNIWSNALGANMVFDQWTGNVSLQQNSGEWHNTFVMGTQDVTVTGGQKGFAPFSLQYEMIKGVNISKKVYYYFPAGHKGVVYLLHGSGGSATNMATDFEWSEMIKDLVAAKYAIVITESEEVSLSTDFNGDGKLNWDATPLDSTTNVDYGNIRALRDTFYHRGYTIPSIPLYSIGMSNGGAFSNALSFLYKFKTGVSYCAQGYQLVFNTSAIPFQFCMAKYDDQPEVGAAGDAAALAYSQQLLARGICSKYFSHDRSPVYPERFARMPGISVAVSTAFFNELKNNHWLDGRNYLKAVSDSLAPIFVANPSVYPTYHSFSVAQRLFVTDEIDGMYAAHQFYTDLNKSTIRFLDSQCQ